MKLASNIANAFLNLYIKEIDKEDFLSIIDFYRFVKSNGKIFFDLQYLEKPVQLELINSLISNFKLIVHFKRLMEVLFIQKRVYLLKDVLFLIILDYQKRTKRYYFEMTSAISLTEEQVVFIKNYINKSLGSDIAYRLSVDENLIAGFQAKSSFYVWENSVSKNLKKIESIIFRELNEGK